MVGLGELRAAGEELEHVVRHAEELQLETTWCEALIALGNVAWRQGEATEARTALAEAERLAERLGNRRLIVTAAFEAAWWAAWFGGEVDGRSRSSTRPSQVAEDRTTARSRSRCCFGWG